jgi:hypothetical protein
VPDVAHVELEALVFVNQLPDLVADKSRDAALGASFLRRS